LWMARGPEPVRAARAHDPRDLGLRRPGGRQPAGARDVERCGAVSRPPCRGGRVPDRAAALRGNRRLRRPLQGPGDAVSDAPDTGDMPSFMDVLGFHLEHADEREAVLRMDVPAALMSPFGQVLGGMIAALLDTGRAVAIARHLGGGERIATHNLNVTYIAFTREP